jgi:CheY-like chemotaxis protein
VVQCRSILIVEDDQHIRNSLQIALDLEGYKTIAAGNGQEAIELLPKMPNPCLILLDLMMPVMSGWEFAEALEKDQILATIPVVVVTAFTEQSKTVRNAKQILKKPVDLNALLDTARKYCGAPGQQHTEGIC